MQRPGSQVHRRKGARLQECVRPTAPRNRGSRLSATPLTTHTFGAFELSITKRSLRLNGLTLALGGRAFDLLVALVERAGRVVTKDELLDAVWGRVVVEEGNLHVHVSALRKLLGPGAIVTIPGRGYQFSPPRPLVSATEGGAPAAAPTVHAAAPPIPHAPTESATAFARPATHNTPALFGRDDELAALQTLLAVQPLVTITGTGGIGKTRLARAALAALAGGAGRPADGSAVVELAALNDPALIPGAIAAALQLPMGGVAAAASGSTADALAALAAAAQPLRMLVLLDNAEHLVDGVAQAAQALLSAGSQLQLLVTSQVPLKVDGEVVYRLGGLAVPDAGVDGDAALSTGDTAMATSGASVAEALRHGALALLNERVRAADRHFALTPANLAPAIAICRQLDGIALAIELVAARVPLLGLHGVAVRLQEHLQLLRAGGANRSAPSRQQTLRAAMDWSHALLTPAQAGAFAQLGVFVGGFTLPVAAQVLHIDGLDEWAAIDLLAELVDRSLVDVVVAKVDATIAPRYRLLETGRVYALGHLKAAGEVPAARQRHALAMCALFETAFDDSWQLPEAAFVARYEPELDNLRAALDWAVQHDVLTAIALAGASSRLWRGLSLHPEALRRFAQARALVDAATPPALAARLWEGTAQLAGEIASTDSRAAALRAEALYAQAGDARGRYLALAHVAFSYRSASPEAEAAFAQMQALEDPAWPAALRLYGRKVEGGLASDAGRVDAARIANEGRLALGTVAGSERDVNAALGNLADLALMGGDAARAVRLGRELLARLSGANHRRHRATRVIALGNLLPALLVQGQIAEARQVLAEFAGLTAQFDHMYVIYAADSMAWLAACEGRWDATAQLLGYGDAAYAADGQAREPNEARSRATAEALVVAHLDASTLVAGMAAGARLQAAEACALALAA